MSRPITSTLPLSTARAPRLRLGQRAGRYRLLEVLGSGAMGTVYRAFDTVLTRHVALKSLHVEDARSRQRFVQEARAMARVSHENVVEIYDVVRARRADGSGDQCLIAMELVEGQTLERWLAAARHWTEIRDVFVAAGRGLAAAHEAGMVHRDFKPANVLVGAGGRARVTDFGLTLSFEERAPTVDEDGEAPHERELEVTSAGHVVGTPAYMAPEQHRGASLSAASDQFAFCAALFEALYGERPFDGRCCRELSRQKHQERLIRIPRGREVPGWLRRVVLRGLRAQPSERFASMDALLQAMQGPAVRRGGLTRWAAAAALVVTCGVTAGLASTAGQSAAGSASAGASVASVASLAASASASSSSPSWRK